MLTSIHRHTLGLAIAVTLGLPVHAFAQLQTGPELASAGTLAPVDKADAAYDPYELSRSAEPTAREGLLDLRLAVHADGSVGDVEVLDGFYSPEFREAALADIAAARFAPAVAGEAPVEWPALELRVIQRGPHAPALTADMRTDLEKLAGLLNERNFAEAETLVREMLSTKAQLLSDYAVLEDQLAAIYTGTDRPHEALIAARNATSSSKAVVGELPPGGDASQFTDDYLVPSLYNDALRRRFLLALALNQTGEARNVFAELERRGALAADDALRAQHDQLNAKLATDEPVGSQIKLVQGKWVFAVSNRKVFGVTGLQEGGQVDYIDIACGANKKRRMPFTIDTEFGLPASWENCSLEFHGKPDTQFVLYEYLN